MNLRLNANAVILNNNREILFIKLKKGPFAGKLCIPGGGINPGEFGFETIKREIREETGIDLRNQIVPFGFCELLNNKIDAHRVVLLFHSIAEGEPKETEEGKAIWLKYEDAVKDLIPFAKDSIKIWKEKNLHFKRTD